MPNYSGNQRNYIQKKHIVHRMVNKTIFHKNGCWLWQGSLNKGHGQIRLAPGLIPEKVHRISAYFFLGYTLYNFWEQVNHKRECPNKNCWNPDHLYVGTQSENVADMVHLGKGKNQWGEY